MTQKIINMNSELFLLLYSFENLYQREIFKIKETIHLGIEHVTFVCGIYI